MEMPTPDERADFCGRVRVSRAPAERQQVAMQMHDLMQARAQERGLTLREGHHMGTGMGCQPGADVPPRAAPAGPTATTGTVNTDGVPPVRHAASIVYQTGRVGVDEVAAMRRTASGYNLRLTFTGSGGDSLAGVGTSILGSKGQEVFPAVSDGPFVYVKMPPGTYRVVVSANGVEKKASVTVPTHGAVSRSFNWPS
jgi:hypothetical protein